MNIQPPVRDQNEDLRFYGFTLSAATAEMMEAKMNRRKLKDVSAYISKLIIEDVVKDAGERA